MTRYEGGFFHSPHALWGTAASGESVILTLQRAGEVVGIALGARRSCRFGRQPRHYYFPTLPALAPSVSPTEALGALAEYARQAQGADLSMDAYDAPGIPDSPQAARLEAARQEYVLDLTPGPEALLKGFCKGHRQAARRGEREGWELRRLYGEEAASVLYEVQAHASTRSSAVRGKGFSVSMSEAVAAQTGAELGSPWGAAVFAAFAGEERLGAVLVGWAGTRAYYTRGGSTPLGYSLGAAPWTHWKIMSLLREQGITVYNLGGTPGEAGTPGHPSHGLHNFKIGFGVVPVPCRGLSWSLSSGHRRVHETADWLVQRLRGLNL